MLMTNIKMQVENYEVTANQRAHLCALKGMRRCEYDCKKKSVTSIYNHIAIAWLEDRKRSTQSMYAAYWANKFENAAGY